MCGRCIGCPEKNGMVGPRSYLAGRDFLDGMPDGYGMPDELELHEDFAIPHFAFPDLGSFAFAAAGSVF